LIHVALISEWPAEGRAAEGGIEVSAERLARELVRCGARVTVIAPSSGEEAHARRHGGGDEVSALRVPADDPLSLLRLLRPWRRRAQTAIRSLGADIVHGQGLIAGGLAAADSRSVPRVVTAHGNPREDTNAAYRGAGGAARAAIRDHLARQVIRRVDAVVGVHPDWRLNLPRKPRRFVHIPNPVDDSYYSTERDPTPGLVVFAGGPRRIKGWESLAEAWPTVRRRFPAATLAVVGWPSAGPAPDLDAAERESVALHPMLTSRELAELLARASAVVIPSQFEVAPLILAEAWAVGVPVVATSVGGVPTLARGAAILVDPGSSAALAAGLGQALEGGGQLDELVTEGHRRAAAYRAESVGRAHLALYNELLGRSS
jgi:glycosyltransferase involved in cell wall biosynthesis